MLTTVVSVTATALWSRWFLCVTHRITLQQTKSSNGWIHVQIYPQNLIICPIAIAYSMGQIIKPVCVCQFIHLSTLSWSHFLINFGKDIRTPKSKNVLIGVNTAPPFCSRNPILGQEVMSIHANINNPISTLNVRESLKILRLLRNWGQGI